MVTITLRDRRIFARLSCDEISVLHNMSVALENIFVLDVTRIDVIGIGENSNGAVGSLAVLDNFASAAVRWIGLHR